MAVVNLLYAGSVLPVEGFGHLVPSTEPDSKVLGALYESSIFPDHNSPGRVTTRVTMMMGGAWFHELFGDPSSCSLDVLGEAAVQAARQQLQLTEEPQEVLVNLHKQCIPQYVTGHCDLVQGMESYLAEHCLSLGLVGAAYRGSSVNDCIRNARLAVEGITKK